MQFYLLTFCVDWFGGGGFFSNKAANISSVFNSMSAMTVNSGESHRLFGMGSSYRKVSASNISLVYGTELLSIVGKLVSVASLSPIVSTFCRFPLKAHAFSAEIAQNTVHCVVLAALLAQYSSYRYPTELFRKKKCEEIDQASWWKCDLNAFIPLI